MNQPFYQPLRDEDLPIYKTKGSTIKIVCGEFHGKRGPAKTHSPMTLLRGELAPDQSVTIPLLNDYNTLIYLLDGILEVNGYVAKGKNMIIFENNGESIKLSAVENTRYIVLSGEPINEPIVAQGPFVMNTEEEIAQAYKDTRQGAFGHLEY